MIKKSIFFSMGHFKYPFLYWGRENPDEKEINYRV